MVVEFYMAVKILLKTHLFMWLALVNKILMWRVLKKRAWHGLDRYIMFKDEDETISHLLIHCPFSKEVWVESLTLT
jgi:hypothetical protein